MKVYFYYLKHPITDEIRYIGQTKRPKDRLHAHIYNARKGHEDNWRANWIRSLLNEGLKPKMEIIEEVEFPDNDYEAVGKRERELIEQHFVKGVRLTNSAITPDPIAPSNKSPLIYQYDGFSLRQLARYASTVTASNILGINERVIRSHLTKSKLDTFAISGKYFWSYEDFPVFPIERLIRRGRGRPEFPIEVRSLILSIYESGRATSVRKIAQLCRVEGFNVSRETVRTTLSTKYSLK